LTNKSNRKYVKIVVFLFLFVCLLACLLACVFDLTNCPQWKHARYANKEITLMDAGTELAKEFGTAIKLVASLS
jgi:hypothetical protein